MITLDKSESNNSSLYESRQHSSKYPKDILRAQPVVTLNESSSNSSYDHQVSETLGSGIQEDPFHLQYLREKPLLDEIRHLRLAKAEAERKVTALQLENDVLIKRILVF